jgi:hypothetical protein
MKQYTLEIESSHSDYERMYMSKGHHPAEEFKKALLEYGEDDPMSEPEHLWIKRVPCNNGDYAFYNNIVDKGTRGAFPATYVFEFSRDNK